MSLKTTFIARASDGLILCESYDSVTDGQIEKLKQNGRDLLKKLSTTQHNSTTIQSTVEVGDGSHKFHYQICDGIIYLNLAEHHYPQKLAFCYLQDVSQSFQSELQNTYGTNGVDYRS